MCIVDISMWPTVKELVRYKCDDAPELNSSNASVVRRQSDKDDRITANRMHNYISFTFQH